MRYIFARKHTVKKDYIARVYSSGGGRLQQRIRGDSPRLSRTAYIYTQAFAKK